MNATVTTASALAIPGNAGRKGLFLQNNGSAAIYFLPGNTPVTADDHATTGGLKLPAGAMIFLSSSELDIAAGVSAIVASGTEKLTYVDSV